MKFIRFIPYVLMGLLTGMLGYYVNSWQYWAFIGIVVLTDVISFIGKNYD